MKNFKTILFISSLIASILVAGDDEEEIKTITKDGVLYKVNNSSLHITPLNEHDEDNAISKELAKLNSGASKVADNNPSSEQTNEDSNESSCPITFSVGTVVPLGDVRDGSNEYDAGTSLSIIVPTSWSFDLFGKSWDVSGELNLANLAGNETDDINMNSVIAHFTPSFDLPVNIDFNLGIAHLDGLGGISGTGSIDVKYNIPLDSADFSIGFRYQKFVDVQKEDPYLDFGLLDVYGFNLGFSKGF